MSSTERPSGTDAGPASASPSELNIDALATYLSSVVDDLDPRLLSATLIAGGRSNPTYALTDGSRRWVLRRPPYGEYVKSGHDMGREVTAMTALTGSEVPVPRVVTYCQDTHVLGAPFYVMDAVEGRTYRTREDTEALREDQRKALSTSLVQTLADLHAVNPVDVGLEDWGRPDGYLSRQLQRWGKQWTAVATSERPEVAAILARLEASMPTPQRTGIVHGDFKIDNIMVDRAEPGRILAVLDWEMSTLGDTMADLGLLVSFWDEPGALPNPITQGATALPGFPNADDIVDSYARRLGAEVDRLDWYVVFSDLKIAVILEQIHKRHLAGTTMGEGFDDIGDMVGPLLERAMERAARSDDPLLRGVGA